MSVATNYITITIHQLIITKVDRRIGITDQTEFLKQEISKSYMAVKKFVVGCFDEEEHVV